MINIANVNMASQSVILLSVILLSVITLSIKLPSDKMLECHSAMWYSAKCHSVQYGSAGLDLLNVILMLLTKYMYNFVASTKLFN